MDVVVRPVGSLGSDWLLEDRLGRPLSRICKTPEPLSPFTVLPQRRGRLDGMPVFHPSLDEALTAVTLRLGGACELVGGSEP